MLKDRDFSISDFEVIENSETRIFELIHKASDYYFRILVRQDGAFNAIFAPSESSLSETTAQRIGWPLVLTYISNWISYVREELESEDPWANLEDEGTFNGDDTAFTPEELEVVDRAIDASAQELLYVAKSKGIEKTLEDIKEDIQYLKEEARNRTRYKWRDLFVEVITTKLVEWGIDVIVMSSIIEVLVKNAEPLLKIMGVSP